MFGKLTGGRHLAKADKLFSGGDYDKARAEYERALEHRPDDPVVHLRYAVFLSETNDFIAAVSHALRAVETRPQSAPYRLFYGIILLDYGRLDEARTQFTEAVNLNPESQLAKDYLALIKIAEGDVASGLSDMASVGLSQNTGFHARALVLLERLVRFGAEQERSKHLEITPHICRRRRFLRNWKARSYLSDGIHLLDVEKWEEAVQQFRCAKELAPEMIEADFQEGVAFFMAGDYKQAEKIMSGLVEQGDEPMLYYGASLAELGRFEESIGVLEKVVQTSAEYNYYLGLYLLSIGKDVEARRHFEPAAAKRHELLRDTLGRACMLHGVAFDPKRR